MGAISDDEIFKIKRRAKRTSARNEQIVADYGNNVSIEAIGEKKRNFTPNSKMYLEEIGN